MKASEKFSTANESCNTPRGHPILVSFSNVPSVSFLDDIDSSTNDKDIGLLLCASGCGKLSFFDTHTYADLVTDLSMHTAYMDQTVFLVEVSIKNTVLVDFTDGVRIVRR